MVDYGIVLIGVSSDIENRYLDYSFSMLIAGWSIHNFLKWNKESPINVTFNGRRMEIPLFRAKNNRKANFWRFSWMKIEPCLSRTRIMATEICRLFLGLSESGGALLFAYFFLGEQEKVSGPKGFGSKEPWMALQKHLYCKGWE